MSSTLKRVVRVARRLLKDAKVGARVGLCGEGVDAFDETAKLCFQVVVPEQGTKKEEQEEDKDEEDKDDEEEEEDEDEEDDVDRVVGVAFTLLNAVVYDTALEVHARASAAVLQAIVDVVFIGRKSRDTHGEQGEQSLQSASDVASRIAAVGDGEMAKVLFQCRQHNLGNDARVAAAMFELQLHVARRLLDTKTSGPQLLGCLRSMHTYYDRASKLYGLGLINNANAKQEAQATQEALANALFELAGLHVNKDATSGHQEALHQEALHQEALHQDVLKEEACHQEVVQQDVCGKSSDTLSESGLEDLIDSMMQASDGFDADSDDSGDAEVEDNLEDKFQQTSTRSTMDRQRLSEFPDQAWRKMKRQGHVVEPVLVNKTSKAWYVGTSEAKRGDMIRVVCFSDTHGLHRLVDLPDGDILVCCGDITMRGELDVLHDFNAWIGEQHFVHKLVVPGNHDLLLDARTIRVGPTKVTKVWKVQFERVAYQKSCLPRWIAY